MKSIKTLIAALFVAMAGTASAQTKNYVHITLNDNSVVHYSQDDIKSMIIDTEEPPFVTFTDGTNTVTVAKMNLGATSVADGTSCYGNYYAWGATETFGTVSYTAYNAGTFSPTKTGGYSQANAPFYNGSAYTKYTSASDATLEAADDAVAANMPGWHMPTQSELQTLFNACGGSNSPTGEISSDQAYPTTAGIYWVTGGNAAVKIGDDTYSVNGMLFVQDADTHVFFPAAGFVDGATLGCAGDNGFYWSSTLYTVDALGAYDLDFYSSNIDTGDAIVRYYGFPVRPFKDAAPAPAPEPEPEADYVEFTAGTYTVKVAKKNLGATTVAESAATSYGNYYAWGATETFGTVSYTAYNAGTVSPTKTGGYSQANAPYYENGWYTKYTGSSDATLEAADDAVAANMPGWHMPTLSELQTLFYACGGDNTFSPTGTISSDQAYPSTAGIYWVTGGNAAVKIGDDTYSVNGMLFVQDADTHVFFPAAGSVDGTTLDDEGDYGIYWSSSLSKSNTSRADGLNFSSSAVGPGNMLNGYRYRGFPIRPFKD